MLIIISKCVNVSHLVHCHMFPSCHVLTLLKTEGKLWAVHEREISFTTKYAFSTDHCILQHAIIIKGTLHMQTFLSDKVDVTIKRTFHPNPSLALPLRLDIW